MAMILILGAGAMGTAFSIPVSDAGNRVSLVGTHLDNEWISALKKGSTHPKLGIKLSKNVKAFFHHELSNAMNEKPDLIVIGVSSPGVRWAIETLGPIFDPSVPVLLLTKGLDSDLRIFPDLVAAELSAARPSFGDAIPSPESAEGVPPNGMESTAPAVGAVGGPCIAKELAYRRKTRVVIGFRRTDVWEKIAPLFGPDKRVPYYKVFFTKDLSGLEVCAAFKNFFAIAVGTLSGLLEKAGEDQSAVEMHNTAAAVFTQALEEMRILVEYCGGSTDSVYGLPGAGDFYVTCQAGRNSRMGRLLGLGLSYEEAKRKHMAEETVEGGDLALSTGKNLERAMESGHLDPESLPLTCSLLDVICHGKIWEYPL